MSVAYNEPLATRHGPLLRAVCAEAVSRPADFDAASASQLLWAPSPVWDGQTRCG